MRNNIPCELCGSFRSENLNERCSNCGAKKYLIIGYRFEGEAKQVINRLYLILAVGIIAFLVGLLYYFWTQSLLASSQVIFLV